MSCYLIDGFAAAFALATLGIVLMIMAVDLTVRVVKRWRKL